MTVMTSCWQLPYLLRNLNRKRSQRRRLTRNQIRRKSLRKKMHINRNKYLNRKTRTTMPKLMLSVLWWTRSNKSKRLCGTTLAIWYNRRLSRHRNPLKLVHHIKRYMINVSEKLRASMARNFQILQNVKHGLLIAWPTMLHRLTKTRHGHSAPVVVVQQVMTATPAAWPILPEEPVGCLVASIALWTERRSNNCKSSSSTLICAYCTLAWPPTIHQYLIVSNVAFLCHAHWTRHSRRIVQYVSKLCNVMTSPTSCRPLWQYSFGHRKLCLTMRDSTR